VSERALVLVDDVVVAQDAVSVSHNALEHEDG